MPCGVCSGKPVEMLNMQTPGQQALDPYVAGAMKEGMGQGATQLPPGMDLSQSPVQPILNAIAMMNAMGPGAGFLAGHQPDTSGFQSGPMYPQVPSGINPMPFSYSGPPDNGTGGGGPTGRDRINPDRFNPTNPNDPRNTPPANPWDPYNLRGRPIPQ